MKGSLLPQCSIAVCASCVTEDEESEHEYKSYTDTWSFTGLWEENVLQYIKSRER